MRNLADCSIAEVWTTKEWVPAHMEQLDPGDIFRIRKADGTLHKNPRGHTVFKAQEPAMIKYEDQSTYDGFPSVKS